MIAKAKQLESRVSAEMRKRFGDNLHAREKRICPECGREYRVGWDKKAGIGRWTFCSYHCCKKYVDRLREEMRDWEE